MLHIGENLSKSGDVDFTDLGFKMLKLREVSVVVELMSQDGFLLDGIQDEGDYSLVV